LVSGGNVSTSINSGPCAGDGGGASIDGHIRRGDGGDGRASIDSSGSSLGSRRRISRAVEVLVSGEVGESRSNSVSDGDELVKLVRVSASISGFPCSGDESSTIEGGVDINASDGDGGARVSGDGRSVGVGNDLRVDGASNGHVTGTEDESGGSVISDVDLLDLRHRASTLVHKTERTGDETVASRAGDGISDGTSDGSAVISGSGRAGVLSGSSAVV